MMSHLDLTSIAPDVPASMAPEVYDLLRDDLGFEGVTITDSLGMGAVAAADAGAAGARGGRRPALMPVDTRTTHRMVATPSSRGEVSRERAEEAAARVVALSGLAARVAADPCPVPVDVDARARVVELRTCRPWRQRLPARGLAWSGREVGVAGAAQLCSASRSSWRTRSAEMPWRAPMSASLCWRPSARP